MNKASSANSVRPNILHIFVDQMRFDSIRALGNNAVMTPNLDRLVNGGCTFTNAFSPSPVCIPARCSMIYGQYPANSGCYENNYPMPLDDRASFMQMLSDAGYSTHGVGKCHFSPDPSALRGFQVRESQEELPENIESDDYLRYLKKNGLERVIDPHGVRGAMYYIPQVSQIPQEYHPTRWVGDRSVDFISKNVRNNKPWYLFSSFIHPHPPFSPPSPWHALYDFDEVPLPDIPKDTRSLLGYVNYAQNRYKYRDQGEDLNLIRMARAYYYSCISFIDYQIGRMLDILDESGTIENTLIVFTADHGEYLGDYGCFGKRGMHDVSSRIPMIVYQPWVFEKNTRVDTVVNLVDLAPTFCMAAGCPFDKASTHDFDGIPLQLTAGGDSSRDFVFSQLAFTRYADGTYGGEYFMEQTEISPEERAESSTYMIVSKDFKYYYSATDGKEFLFDRIRDPKETRNRANTPNYKDTTKKLRNLLIEHLVENGETEGIINGVWKEYPGKKVPDNPDEGLLVQKQPWVTINLPGYEKSVKR
jgi:arylsulfatase